GRKAALNLAAAFLGGVFFWLLTNSWWLIPTFNISPALFANQHTTDDSLTTLVALSNQTSLPFTLRLINPFYLYWHADFGSIYQTPLFVFISWLFILVVFVGFIKGLKEKTYAMWSLLFLIVLMLAKGAAPPFSFPYIFGFSHFFPLGVIRNPFEKLGILLPLIYAILFALGFWYLLVTLPKLIGKFKSYLVLVTFVILHSVFLWPMWAGNLFGSLEKPMFVQIPESYHQANDWIKNDLSDTANNWDGRILHLPLPQSEDITYTWQYGYSGVEPSAAIFTSLPSIARGLDIPGISNALAGLSFIFHKPYASNPGVIVKMLQDFNIRYIILHKDIEWKEKQLYNPQETELILDKLEFLERKAGFGNLIIYKLKSNYFKHKITLFENAQLVSTPHSFSMWPWLLHDKKLMVTTATSFDGETPNAKDGLLFPKDSFNYINIDQSTKDSVINRVLNDPSSADLLFEPMARVTSLLVENSEVLADQLNKKIILSSKKLVEVAKLNGLGIEEYQNYLEDIFKKDPKQSRLFFYIQRTDFTTTFLLHSHLLKIIHRSDIALYLESRLKEYNFLPEYQEGVTVFKFEVPYPQSYQILLPDYLSQVSKEDLNGLRIRVNDKFQNFSSINGNLISFGEHKFERGHYEISIPQLLSKNLFLSYDQLIKAGDVSLKGEVIQLVTTSDKVSFIENELPNNLGGDTYKVSLDVKQTSGKGFYVQLIQDTDNENSIGQKNYQVNQYINQIPTSGFQSYNLVLPPLRTTTQFAAIRILVIPQQNFFSDYPSIHIRNFKIQKILGKELFLKNSIGEENSEQKEVLSNDMISPVFYHGKVRISKPTFLIFNETFHPEWKLVLDDGKRKYFPKSHLIANLYGNAWYIDEVGEYNFKIEFSPKKIVNIGVTAGIATTISLLIFTLYKMLKHRKNEPL
ncbi:DUF3367 domain-containing protein, partial [Candidatus Daviesbacteria bacterium]|nr:DUF3367 domain-containing protein [Candidatus Daviesbacteria bacterium]